MSYVEAALTAHIVDDDLAISELLAQMLRKQGFGKIVKSHSIKQATEQHGDSVCDVYFVDIELSDGNGLDFISEIRTQYPLAKVIVFSGNTTSANVNAAYGLGINAFLVKPFSISSLERVLLQCGLMAAVA